MNDAGPLPDRLGASGLEHSVGISRKDISRKYWELGLEPHEVSGGTHSHVVALTKGGGKRVSHLILRGDKDHIVFSGKNIQWATSPAEILGNQTCRDIIDLFNGLFDPDKRPQVQVPVFLFEHKSGFESQSYTPHELYYIGHYECTKSVQCPGTRSGSTRVWLDMEFCRFDQDLDENISRICPPSSLPPPDQPSDAQSDGTSASRREENEDGTISASEEDGTSRLSDEQQLDTAEEEESEEEDPSRLSEDQLDAVEVLDGLAQTVPNTLPTDNRLIQEAQEKVQKAQAETQEAKKEAQEALQKKEEAELDSRLLAHIFAGTVTRSASDARQAAMEVFHEEATSRQYTLEQLLEELIPEDADTESTEEGDAPLMTKYRANLETAAKELLNEPELETVSIHQVSEWLEGNGLGANENMLLMCLKRGRVIAQKAAMAAAPIVAAQSNQIEQAAMQDSSETQPSAASNQREDDNGDTREMVVEEIASAPQAVGSVDLDSLTIVVLNLCDSLDELQASEKIGQCEDYVQLMIERVLDSKGRQDVLVPKMKGKSAFSRLVPRVDAFVKLLDVSQEEDVNTFLECKEFLNSVKKEARKSKEEAAASSTEQLDAVEGKDYADPEAVLRHDYVGLLMLAAQNGPQLRQLIHWGETLRYYIGMIQANYPTSTVQVPRVEVDKTWNNPVSLLDYDPAGVAIRTKGNASLQSQLVQFGTQLEHYAKMNEALLSQNNTNAEEVRPDAALSGDTEMEEE